MAVSDYWEAFLEARMNVIKAAVQEGMTVDEIAQLVNIKDMQAILLVRYARAELEK